MLAARRFGAEGVGLYRSEFLYLREAPGLPGEEEHYRTYRELAEKALPNEVVIRTLDLGGEKYFSTILEGRESNPVMGLRGIRLCLKREDMFRAQLRGVFRAAAFDGFPRNAVVDLAEVQKSLVARHELGAVLPAVVDPDADVLGRDDVVVDGEDVPLGRNDDADGVRKQWPQGRPQRTATAFNPAILTELCGP